MRRLRHDVEDGAVEAPQHRHVHRSLLFCIDLHPYLCLCVCTCVCVCAKGCVYLVGFGCGFGWGRCVREREPRRMELDAVSTAHWSASLRWLA